MKLQQTTKVNYSYKLRKLIILIFYSILNTTNMVKTCDYLYLNKDIHFENFRALEVPNEGLGIKTVSNSPR